MNANYLYISLILLTLVAFKSDKPAYLIFSAEGKNVSYEKMMKQLQDADIVFFGELHDNSVAHWLEFEIAKDLHQVKKTDLVIGAEMFEADNQLIIDEYFGKQITESKFEAEMRLWKNYKTDYKPIVKLAKDSSLRLVATNIPRRYAAIVSSKGLVGLDKLSDEAKHFFAPLPIEFDSTVACYRDMLKMDMGEGHDNMKFTMAQAAKDATMAHFILKNYSKGKLFYHFNGSYHSDNHEGIIWYLKKANPNLHIVTVSTIEQKNIEEVEKENLNKSDFIILIPENMTKTY